MLLPRLLGDPNEFGGGGLLLIPMGARGDAKLCLEDAVGSCDDMEPAGRPRLRFRGDDMVVVGMMDDENDGEGDGSPELPFNGLWVIISGDEVDGVGTKSCAMTFPGPGWWLKTSL